jgi:hypothetical protein
MDWCFGEGCNSSTAVPVRDCKKHFEIIIRIANCWLEIFPVLKSSSDFYENEAMRTNFFWHIQS